MRLLLQRVSSASVVSNGKLTGDISTGLVVFCGVGPGDDTRVAREMAKKVAEIRIFSDNDGKMNKSVQDIAGGVLVVSQFTLYADTSKGRRPFFGGAAKPDAAEMCYEVFMEALRASGLEVESGIFGADMKVSLVNDGPVTLWLDSAC